MLGAPLCLRQAALQETVDLLLHDPGPVPTAGCPLTEVDTLGRGLSVGLHPATTEDLGEVGANKGGLVLVQTAGQAGLHHVQAEDGDLLVQLPRLPVRVFPLAGSHVLHTERVAPAQ